MTQSLVAERSVRALAGWVSAVKHTDLPHEVLHRTRMLIADSLAATMRGAAEPEPTHLWRTMPGAGDATVLRHDFPHAPLADAVVANSVAMCALELDPGSRPSGHPMLHVMPIALAVAESEAISGQELECALVTGYEAHARFQWAIGLDPRVHAHGALAAIGATAAVGKLRGWDADRLATGFALAASLPVASSWLNATHGRSVRDLYAAAGATIALLVSQATEAGFGAADGILDETYGSILGHRVDPDPLEEDLGTRFWILDAYVKFHAACLLVHPVVDAVADALDGVTDPGSYPPLRLDQPPDAGKIATIRVWVPDRSLKLDVQPDTSLGARFSIPHMVAYFLVYGTSGPEASDVDALRDERVRNLAQRVDIHEDAELTRMWPDSLAARVEIEFVDGIKARGDCRDPIGTRGRLDTSEAVRAKYNSLLAGVLPRDHADALWSAVQSLEDVSDVRHLFEVGRTLTRGQTVAAAATAALVRGGGGRRSAESHKPSIPAGIDRTP